MTTHPSPAAVSLDTFRERLAAVLQSRQRIAEVTEQVSTTMSRSQRTEIQRVAHFIAQPGSPDDVLRHPAALSICLPLVAAASERAPTDSEIEASVHRWIHETRHHRGQVQRRLTAFLYPLVVLLITLLIMVAICFLLIPEFENMFREFGLSLPAPTLALIGLSHLLHDYGVALLLALAVVAFVLVVLARMAQKPGGSSWRSSIDAKFESDRGAIADWASRIASLVEAGLSRNDAMAIAGAVGGKAWLRRGTEAWVEELKQGRDPIAEMTHIRHRPCHLLAHALRLPNAASQASLLHEVAKIYRGRDQQRSGWWIGWFSQLAICAVGLMIGLVVLALLMPLVSLITGLS